MRRDDLTVKTEMVEGLRVRVEYDSDPPNPRKEFDHLGTFAFFHDRYLTNESSFDSPEDFMAAVKEESRAFKEGKRAKTALADPYYSLPVSAYIHSGITLWTGRPGDGPPGSNCPWDSGQVGWVYVQRSQVLKEWGVSRVTPAVRKQLYERLASEVKEYDMFLTGQVYGFIVEEPISGDPNDETDCWEQVDSCWGFYGSSEECLQAGVEAAKYELRQREKARQQEREKHDDA